MHAEHMRAAKKKALSELIRHMRGLELRGSADHSGAKGPVDLADEDDGAYDMGDDETNEPGEGTPAEEREDMNEDDPKAQLEHFMKKGGRTPSKSRASIVIAVKSPAQKMKKTFGKM